MKQPTLHFAGRMDSLDIMRGWFLMVIAFDHLLRIPSLFDAVTGRGLLWVTAAEGFFFISGMLVGIARGRDMHQAGLRAATRRILKRAGTLYVASVILTLLYMAAGYWMASHGVPASKGGLTYFSSVPEMLRNVFNLNYTYGWADFLGFYAVFLALSPLALWLLRRKLWWVVLGLSLGLWLIKDHVTLPFLGFYAIWQTYFFFGMVFGYRFNDTQAYYRTIPARTAKYLKIGLLVSTAVTILASFIFTFGTPFFLNHGPQLSALFQALHLPSPDACYNFFFEVKENMIFNDLLQNDRTGLLRLPMFFLWFSCLFMLVRRYESQVIRAAGWLLLPLGRNSLYVYIIQSVLAFGLPLLLIPMSYGINTLIDIIAIGICWLCVRQRFLFRIIPR